MKALKKVAFITLSASIIFTQYSQAQDTLVAPEPVKQDGRFNPAFGDEGLVKVRYTVKADGTTDDIELTGYLSNQFLTPMLRQTVKDWTFKPGTVNGIAADFYNQEYVFAMRINPDAPAMPMGPGRGGRGAAPDADVPPIDYSTLPTPPLTLSQDAKETVDIIYATFAEKDYDKAFKDVTKLLRSQVHTAFDYSLAQELKSIILMTRDEYYEALEASNLATLHNLNAQGEVQYFLEASLLENALRRKLILTSSLRQNALAWSTYEALTSLFDVPADDGVHEQAKAIRATLDSPEPLPLLARITDKQWTYAPSRRIFTVTDVKGKLNSIEARCERRNLKLDFQEGVDWTLPASLGACELDFIGKNDTQFTVYEFAE